MRCRPVADTADQDSWMYSSLLDAEQRAVLFDGLVHMMSSATTRSWTPPAQVCSVRSCRLNIAAGFHVSDDDRASLHLACSIFHSARHLRRNQRPAISFALWLILGTYFMHCSIVSHHDRHRGTWFPASIKRNLTYCVVKIPHSDCAARHEAMREYVNMRI